jgi:hypothetical protein
MDCEPLFSSTAEGLSLKFSDSKARARTRQRAGCVAQSGPVKALTLGDCDASVRSSSVTKGRRGIDYVHKKVNTLRVWSD